jgi:urea transport system substrate-binding protein
MWAQAVKKAGTTDVNKVIKAMGGQTVKAPSGYTLKMDETNHHLWKPVMIGEVQANGQFDVVWKTPKTIQAKPWSPFIAGNDKKLNKPSN